MQLLYDCGLITEFDPSMDISYFHNISYFHIVNRANPAKVSLTVPPNSGLKIDGLKSLIIFSNDNDKTFEFLPRFEIVNETKGKRWSHCEHFVGFGDTKNILTWFSSWRLRGEIEAGDHVSFMVLSDLHLIKCVVDLVYEDETVLSNDVMHAFDSLDYRRRCRTNILGPLFGVYIYNLYKSHRSLYRMQSLVKD